VLDRQSYELKACGCFNIRRGWEGRRLTLCATWVRAEEKMADFERQVEELSGRVSSLMEEKRTLESRNSLLERVVQLKQDTCTETVRRRLEAPRPWQWRRPVLGNSCLATAQAAIWLHRHFVWLLACCGGRTRFIWVLGDQDSSQPVIARAPAHIGAHRRGQRAPSTRGALARSAS